MLQGAWAQLLMLADRSARCRLRHRGLGAAGRGGRRGIDGGPVDQHGAGAGDASRAATTTADLLDQLQSAHNDTLEHQHLALSEIHRVTGHDQLFDTLFVYENYPIDTAALAGADGLAITEFTSREYNHYPLTVQAVPGRELGLRVEFDTDVFDAASIEALIERLRAGVGGDDRRPGAAVVVDGSARCRLSTPGWMRWGNRAVLTQPATAPVSIPVLFAAQVARTPEAVALSCRGPLDDLPRAG